MELSESPAAHADNTNTRSGGLSVTFDLSPVAFLASWNTFRNRKMTVCLPYSLPPVYAMGKHPDANAQR